MPVPADRPPRTFRLVVVPGVTPDKWSRVWSQRLPKVDLRLVPVEVAAQAATIADAAADAGLVRLPVDRDVFDAIPLYTETTVVVVGRDHVITAAEELTVADLAAETLLAPLDDVLTWTAPPATAAPATAAPGTAAPATAAPGTAAPGTAPPGTAAPDRPATTADAVELVAAGAGVLVVPQSLARRYHRRDLTYRVVTDAPTSTVALAWVSGRHTDLVEEMIGIVRGRTANSTRGRAPTPPAPRRRRGR
jgi:DNA-binding transcriptional LysR family regulator